MRKAVETAIINVDYGNAEAVWNVDWNSNVAVFTV
jgi:hypothetical protein